VIQNIILLGIIFLLLHLANVTEALSFITRPIVVMVADALGIPAIDRGNEILLGQVVLPWNQDCSGINGLILLLGITLWVNRHQRFGIPFLLRLSLCIPAALISNVFRILTFAAYRHIFYPNWESPQVHYLIGFIWLIPFIVLLVKDFRHRDWAGWLEILYMAMLLALLAPVVFSPGGSVVALCTLFYLAQNRLTDIKLGKKWVYYVLWAGAALFIGLSRMESLWIPWLLLCPRFVARPVLFSWTGPIILSGTVPLLAMRFEWQCVVVAALAVHIYGRWKRKKGPGHQPLISSPKAFESTVLLAFTLAPFILPSVAGMSHDVAQPPTGAMANRFSLNSYVLRVVGQPSDISLFWYGPYGDGRHHTLSVCMRFRGVIMKPVDKAARVLTSGDRWMREFFIHGGKLRMSYQEYLLASFSPFSSPGIHIIVEAPADMMSAVYFDRESERWVKRLYEMYAKP
jgi:exosortase/archaeosortase family protein